ncbi:MAG: ATP-dependent helicase HrpB, partial [Actinomycetota bacterium]|nr:ATP-dependent helicase HrpB [Actinomycetota bacterium]
MIGDTGLPVEECVPALRTALAADGQAVLQAPPGAGKTTVVPLRLLDEPWLAGGRIVMLEPRRLATRAAARRMAALLGEDVGGTVGYRTRDERRTGPRTRIEVVTEGILTRRLQQDPSLPGVGLVIFDEFHERNLHADLALALTLDARPALRPDLRLLVMSATIDTARIATLLAGASAALSDRSPGNRRVTGGGPGDDGAAAGARHDGAEAGVGPAGGSAPVIASEGRAWPVEIRYTPSAPPARKAGYKGRPGPPPRPGSQVAGAATRAVLRALREETGDVLVFLPGAGDIRRVATALGERGSGLPDGVDIRPLYGALSIADQDAALAPSPPGRRRVVLATDIAETSLTVAGVRVVVDGGWHRTPRYDPRSGLTRLETVGITKASADQRAGRAGRTEPGVAYRLWSKVEHAARRPFPDPEIATADLSGLALELAVWGGSAAVTSGGTPEVPGLPFLDPPPARALEEGQNLLRFLGALDADGRPTAAGRAMAELPLHPRLARMVIGAAAAGRGGTACALAALLEERDVLRGRPDEIETDVAVRLWLLVDREVRHPQADGPAVAAARRRAGELARRVGVEPPGPDDALDPGPVLALAYPDRIGQARGGGRFRLRGGGGGWLAAGEPLSGEAFLVAAELDAAGRSSAAAGKDSRIRLAAPLDTADVEAVATATGAAVERFATLSWDATRDDLRARTERRLDNLVIGETEGPADPGPATTAALLARVRSTKLALLGWTDAARALQARIAFARHRAAAAAEGRSSPAPLEPERITHRKGGHTAPAPSGSSEPGAVEAAGVWPDLSDSGLLASLDDWLVPLLGKASGRADLERVDMAGVLRRMLGHRVAELDRVAPAAITLAGGRQVPVDY